MNGGRKIKAALLLAATVALLGSAFLHCEAFCCLFEGELEVHAAMPCCTARAAIARPEIVRADVVTVAKVIPPSQEMTAPPVASPEIADAPPVDHPPSPSRERHRSSSPPPFLEHAQLLI